MVLSRFYGFDLFHQTYIFCFVFVTIIWCENWSAAYLFVNSIFQACIKHFEVNYYFVHDKVTKKDIQI